MFTQEQGATDDKFHDECGLMGVVGHPEAANLTYLGLFAQQHRGQEGAGVVAVDERAGLTPHFSVHKGLGLVPDVFSDFDFDKLPGRCAIGHVRYTTAGGSKLANVQPLYAEISKGHVALAHNGNLTNTDELRQLLISKGAIFSGTADTELFLHFMARSPERESRVETLFSALAEVEGAFSLLVLFDDRLFALRDPNGFRPLALGKLENATVVASETCAFDLIGAEYIRDVAPGEVVEIHFDGTITSHFPFMEVQSTPCVFEYVYFARPDSRIFGRHVYAVRKRLGAVLAEEQPVEADVVIPVPDSGVTAALGYAEKVGLPMELGLIRNHYVGRTFIEPKQSIRSFGVRIKHNANVAVLEGKRVVVVDDSLVRGTTSRKLVRMLRQAGAREVHMRISAPPTVAPCYYGIDTPRREELIAANYSIDEIRDSIGVDSLAYLSVEGLHRAVGEGQGKMCAACFTNDYPIRIGGLRQQ